MFDISREVLIWPNPLLGLVGVEETEFGTNLENLLRVMVGVVKKENAYGLAACQVGTNTSVFIASIGDGKDFFSREIKTFVNPTIMNCGGPKLRSVEQCLSLPGTSAVIKSRYAEIVVAAFDIKGIPFQEKYIKSDAIVIQHEMAHLKGKTLLDEVGSAKRTLMKNKIRKITRLRRRK